MSNILCKYCGTPVDPSVAPDALCGCDGEVLAEKDAEIERLRERIAELEEERDKLGKELDHWTAVASCPDEARGWKLLLTKGHHITEAQIDAAWEHATHGPSGIVFLRADLLGIERCPSGKGWIKT